ncbi:dna mismatch repair protein muts core [Trichococcus palustris]|jgi:DNA mismatch repair protein MutS2|uniref:Endonuclease MutS2 n=1 Tax=Trichococcus palustris TaxID=140314 RepID=A0A143YFJ2_9LACT|nr:endonuclease MutS2 [Trichococcus palustris]CZQ87699.1 dna mismatch repair protein muts core [Trichococcus palustris]SFK78152.1 DNA mismatch repair protein MutS2 [Trichococcus palustris]
MNTKITKTLEFEKIKQQIQAFAATDLGKEKIQQLHPETDAEKVAKLQDETEDGRKVLRLKGGIPMPRLKSIKSHLKRLEIGGTLNGKEIAEIGRVLTTTKEIIHFFQWFEDNEIEFFVLDEIIAKLVVLPEITRKIQDTVYEDGSILNDATSVLKGIRTGIKQGEQNIRTKLDDIIRGKKAAYLSDAIVTIRNDRYVIPVKLEYRNQFGGIVHDQSSTGQTLYIEPQAILELNNHLRELAAKEKAEIDRILYELSMEIEPFSHELYRNSEVLATLDFINAKARYAESLKGTRPIISAENHIAIWQARHPLIDQTEVVPNDLILGEEYQAIVITGPNTGGKTIMLKTLGIIQMMGQSGLQIPANENSQIGIFTEIFADIGDEQSIEQSLSTFSSHMTNIVSILNQIDDKSLLLLDELGSGTDPQEGASLAIAILDYIGGIGSYVMATTHYPELKAYGYNRPGTINASMEFNVDTLAPTYRLQIGVPGRSNAFDISKRLGLKTPIIDQARSFIDVDSQNLNEMIADLEQKRRVTEMESNRLKKQLEESDALLEDLKTANEKLELSKEKVIEEAKKEANKLVATAKEEAEFLLQEIREMQMNLGAKNAVKEHELIDLRKQFDKLHQEESLSKNKVLRKEKEKKQFKVGDEVITETYGQRGTLVEKTGNAEWVVQMGIMKMKLPESDLRIIKEEPQPQNRKRQMATIKSASSSHVSPQLDLRGQRYEEALAEVDQYLDAALLAGYPQVTIVHGKGTGALRKGVAEYLKRHPQVKSYEFAPMNAGGNGATIVTFKG